MCDTPGTETLQHAGLASPRSLPGGYHRLGAATCISGAYRYHYRRA